MIRAFLDKITDWMDDDNDLIAAAKFLSVLAVGFFLPVTLIFVGIVAWADSGPAFTLQKSEWQCTQSHTERVMTMAGKVPVMTTETVCDEYRKVR